LSHFLRQLYIKAFFSHMNEVYVIRISFILKVDIYVHQMKVLLKGENSCPKNKGTVTKKRIFVTRRRKNLTRVQWPQK
jgi:hypothetical protein